MTTNDSYIKGECYECRGSIEFPSSVTTEEVDCPHCGKQIMLSECKPEASLPVVLPSRKVTAPVLSEVEMLKLQIVQLQHNQIVNLEQQRNEILAASVQQQRRANTISGGILGVFAFDVLSNLFD